MRDVKSEDIYHLRKATFLLFKPLIGSTSCVLSGLKSHFVIANLERLNWSLVIPIETFSMNSINWKIFLILCLTFPIMFTQILSLHTCQKNKTKQNTRVSCNHILWNQYHYDILRSINFGPNRKVNKRNLKITGIWSKNSTCFWINKCSLGMN